MAPDPSRLVKMGIREMTKILGPRQSSCDIKRLNSTSQERQIALEFLSTLIKGDKVYIVAANFKQAEDFACKIKRKFHFVDLKNFDTIRGILLSDIIFLEGTLSQPGIGIGTRTKRKELIANLRDTKIWQVYDWR